MTRKTDKMSATLHELNLFQLAILCIFVPSVYKAYKEKSDQCRILVRKNDRLERSNAQLRGNGKEWWK